MNIQRCDQGHYYDSDKYLACPHCTQDSQDESSETDSNRTLLLNIPMGASTDDSKTDVFTQHTLDGQGEKTDSVSHTGTLKQVERFPQTGASDEDDEQKTGRVCGADGITAPVVGWLVGISKGVYGRSFVLKANKNFIGRGENMDVIIEGDYTVSLGKHAILIFEPRAKQFIVMTGDTNELCYVNDEVVLEPKYMKKNDILSLGNTRLMLIPCCDDFFDWNNVE